MNGQRSLSDPRLLRFLGVYNSLLFALFIDTLFFSLFFPDTGQCESYAAEGECISTINSATNRPQCQWTPADSTTGSAVSGSCYLNPPPENIIFSVILSSVTMLLTIPTSFIFDYVRFEVCAKRPDLEEIGINPMRWLGLATYDVARTNVKDNLQEGEEDFNLTTIKGLSRQSLQSMEGISKIAHLEHLNNDQEASFLSRMMFTDMSSLDEEADHILREVQYFYSIAANRIPISAHSQLELSRSQSHSLAIKKSLGLDEHGRWRQLTLRKKLMYGDPHDRLKKKLMKSRQGAQELEKILAATDGELSAMDNDIALIQYFVLEQLPPFQRFALKYQSFAFPNVSSSTVHPLIWVAGWAFLYGMNCFFIYWILLWCLTSGGATMKAWGINYLLAFIQDVFFVQMFKVYFLYIGTVTMIVPNLRSMFQSLGNLAMKLEQSRLLTHEMTDLQNSMNDFRVVQYLSSACRAARKKQFAHLLAAKLLHYVDDRDLYHCRYVQEKVSTTLINLFLFSVPVMLLYFGEYYAHTAFEVLFPMLSTSAFVAFAVVYVYSKVLFAIFFVILLLLLFGKSKIKHVYLRACNFIEKQIRYLHNVEMFAKYSGQRNRITNLKTVCKHMCFNVYLKSRDGVRVAGDLLFRRQSKVHNLTWEAINLPLQVNADSDLYHTSEKVSIKPIDSHNKISKKVIRKTSSAMTMQSMYHDDTSEYKLYLQHILDSLPDEILRVCEFSNKRFGYDMGHNNEGLYAEEGVDEEMGKMKQVEAARRNKVTPFNYTQHLLGRQLGLTSSALRRSQFVCKVLASPVPKIGLVKCRMWDGTQRKVQMPDLGLLAASRSNAYDFIHYATNNSVDAILRGLMLQLGLETDHLKELLDGVRKYLLAHHKSGQKKKVYDRFTESKKRKKIWKTFEGVSMLQKDMEVVLQHVLNFYQPNGKPLNKAERKEIEEDFAKWSEQVRSSDEHLILLNWYLLWYEDIVRRIEGSKGYQQFQQALKDVHTGEMLKLEYANIYHNNEDDHDILFNEYPHSKN